MKKCKILSAVLSLAMSVSLITPMTHAYGGAVLYTQDFESVTATDIGAEANTEVATDGTHGKIFTVPDGKSGNAYISGLDIPVNGKINLTTDIKIKNGGVTGTLFKLNTDAGTVESFFATTDNSWTDQNRSQAIGWGRQRECGISLRLCLILQRVQLITQLKTQQVQC